MSTAQIENLIIQNSKGLPEDVLREILDFIQFLKFKKASTLNDSIKVELSGLNSAEVSHLEEEFVDYKTIYPQE